MNDSTRNTLFSSKTDLWSTPQGFYERLDSEFNFTLDPCSDGANNKCDFFYTERDDGLSKDWAPHTVFMNPPYGREIRDWIRKAYEESLKGSTVVALIPARTDTRYWHEYVMKSNEVRLVRGRIKFGDNCDSAPFPSAVVIFKESGGGYPVLSIMNNVEVTE